MRTRPWRPVASVPGFALVEVLVALLLVAFATLGVAHVQLGALRAGGRSLEALAEHGHVLGLADRIRALHDAPPTARALLAGDGANHDCRGDRRCTPEEFAAYEAWTAREHARTLRNAAVAPVVVRLDAVPAHFEVRVRRSSGAVLAVEVAS